MVETRRGEVRWIPIIGQRGGVNSVELGDGHAACASGDGIKYSTFQNGSDSDSNSVAYALRRFSLTAW